MSVLINFFRGLGWFPKHMGSILQAKDFLFRVQVLFFWSRMLITESQNLSWNKIIQVHQFHINLKFHHGIDQNYYSISALYLFQGVVCFFNVLKVPHSLSWCWWFLKLSWNFIPSILKLSGKSVYGCNTDNTCTPLLIP